MASGQAYCTSLALAERVAERLIGSIRRECVDHFIVLARRICAESCDLARYYNEIRTHQSLIKMRQSLARFS